MNLMFFPARQGVRVASVIKRGVKTENCFKKAAYGSFDFGMSVPSSLIL